MIRTKTAKQYTRSRQRAALKQKAQESPPLRLMSSSQPYIPSIGSAFFDFPRNRWLFNTLDAGDIEL